MKRHYLILVVITLVILIALLAQTLTEEVVERESFLMDTFVSIKIFSNDTEAAEQAINEALTLMADYDRMLDRYAPPEESLVSRINHAVDQKVFSLASDIEPIFQTAQEVAVASKGAFDITVGVAVDMWKQSEIDASEPTQAEIDTTIGVIDYNQLIIKDSLLKKINPETVIDLGGVAKGAIVEIGANYLRDQGFTSAIIDGGGNIQTVGSHRNNKAFRIGIANPTKSTETLGYVDVIDQAVVTAGIYQRFYTINDINYHHILSPYTARPVDNNLLSVTLIANSSQLADALSTACVVLGERKALELIESYPNVEGLLITKDQRIVLSSGMDQFTLTQGDYHVHP